MVDGSLIGKHMQSAPCLEPQRRPGDPLGETLSLRIPLLLTLRGATKLPPSNGTEELYKPSCEAEQKRICAPPFASHGPATCQRRAIDVALPSSKAKPLLNKH